MKTDEPKLTDAELNEWMAVNVGGMKPDFWNKGLDCDGVHIEVAPNYTGSGDRMLEVMGEVAKRGIRVDIKHEQTTGKYRVVFSWPKYACSELVDAADLPRALCELCYELKETDDETVNER